MNTNKDLNKFTFYKKISDLYAGLGTILIDGDALIDYLQLSPISQDLSSSIDAFIDKLKKCGFDKIEVILFNDYFCKSHKYAKNDLETLFKNQKSLIFDNVEEDEKWTDYISNEQISMLLTNIFLNQSDKMNEWVGNSYISKIMKNNEITIGILNEINFSGTSVYTFLFDYRLLINNDISLIEYNNPVQDLHENIELVLSKYGQHIIKNRRLIDILANKNVQVGVYQADSITSPFNFDSLWITKPGDEASKEAKLKAMNNNAKFQLISDQKFSRYMERYSQSLNASKHYHHKIIISNGGQQSQSAKKVTKAILDQDIDSPKLRADDEQQVENIEKYILASIDLNEKLIKLDSLIEQSPGGHSKIYLLLLRKLKLKILQQYSENNKMDSTKVCFILKEIIENHRDLLSELELAEYLKKLETNGFKETSKFLNKAIIPEIVDEDSFNKEVYLQLKFNGDKLKRTLNSKNDSRVKFKPDEWQVKLLDVVDRNDSALVCCPTSSGKTFICYYAMEKILRSNNLNDMIVFVSPNKALVNQVVAEIYTRFGDRKYPQGIHKTVYATCMPDYNNNDPFECQILVTVPEMLETLLSSKINTEWIKNIKYVIIDEIQTINDVELGASIEKIMHFIDCPLLGLSATISNFDEFYNWFNSIEKFKKKQILHKISHYERYCDLQRFLFIPKNDAIEATQSYVKGKELMKLPVAKDDTIECLIPINEMLAYSKSYLKKHEYAYDFHLLPTEIAIILDALEIVINEDNEEQVDLIYSCYPDQFFKTTLINKNDVKEYEKFLMKNFKTWIINDIFTDEQIRRLYFLLNGKCLKAFEILRKKYETKSATAEWALDHVFELVSNLKKNKMLPAIVFTKNYHFADALAKALVITLKDNERMAQKQNDKNLDKNNKKEIKILEKQLKDPKLDDIEKSEIREKIFDLENEDKGIPDEFTFLNSNKLPLKEIEEEIEMHKHRKIEKIFFEAWHRGIGVHHETNSTKYRSSVEYLFRRGHLQIVFATETLALGINMPCKTVVMTNECLFLDTMMYRQMIGRAGRRGFDTIGNIVYFGVPENKVKSFISSDLIKLKSSKFSFDLTNILHLSMLNFKNNENMKFLDTFVKHPFSGISNNSVISNTDVVRSQIIYLMEHGYLTEEFKPKKIANLLLPLRNKDCNPFLICELLQNKVFNKIINQKENVENNAKKLLLALCHFTKPILIPPSISGCISKDVILPNIPEIDDFIQHNNKKFDSFFEWAFVKDKETLTNDKIEEKKSYFKTAFPYYNTFPRNSYVYNYYISRNLAAVEKKNLVTESELWEAYETLRYLTNTLFRFVKFKHDDNSLLPVIEYCNVQVNQRFESINN